MDKLKEVQKYQFWILLGVSLILPLVGWGMATSGYVKETQERTTALKDLYGKLSVTTNDPNADWSSKLEDINKSQEKQKEIAWRELYARQKPMMTWPAKLQLGDDPSKLENWQQAVYRQEYPKELDKIRLIVKPVDEDFQNGLMVFPEELLPPREPWPNQAPEVPQILAAQEDVWLLTALLECVASVNQDSTTPFDAPIRQIELINLRGGSVGKGGSSGAKTTTGSSGSTGAAPSGMAKQMEEMGKALGGMRKQDSGMGGMGGTGTGAGINDPRIDADDVLGPETAAASPAKSADTKKDAALSMSTMGGLSQQMGRYREDKTEWKTRGFELQVIMDHRRIPELLVALSNCPWPVNILRVQEADAQDEDLIPADSSSGFGSPMMSGGMKGSMGGSMGMKMPMMSGPTGTKSGTGPSFGSGMSNALSNMQGGTPSGGAKTSMPRSTRPPSAGLGEEGEGPSGIERSPLEDPNLSNVAIVGVIYIFKEPPKPAAPAPGGPGAPGSSPGAPAAQTQTAAAQTAPANNGAAPVAEAATESNGAAAEEEKTAAADEDMQDAAGKEGAADNDSSDDESPPAKPEEKTD